MAYFRLLSFTQPKTLKKSKISTGVTETIEFDIGAGHIWKILGADAGHDQPDASHIHIYILDTPDEAMLLVGKPCTQLDRAVWHGEQYAFKNVRAVFYDTDAGDVLEFALQWQEAEAV